jgi:hypothetical protein
MNRSWSTRFCRGATRFGFVVVGIWCKFALYAVQALLRTHASFAGVERSGVARWLGPVGNPVTPVVDCAIAPLAKKAANAKTASKRHAVRTTKLRRRLPPSALSTRPERRLIIRTNDYRANAPAAQGEGTTLTFAVSFGRVQKHRETCAVKLFDQLPSMLGRPMRSIIQKRCNPGDKSECNAIDIEFFVIKKGIHLKNKTH